MRITRTIGQKLFTACRFLPTTLTTSLPLRRASTGAEAQKFWSRRIIEEVEKNVFNETKTQPRSAWLVCGHCPLRSTRGGFGSSPNSLHISTNGSTGDNPDSL